ncbi:hypothetical protein F511_39517 [Dorcoceras hygrometricum]|uniref:Uncharacterized protein n=1 Tax=Dorcoceras hygrometricum TaxID=472368 RepID=A0A2Z7CTF9_9LAMI|nr:hypothetical protein F511_39517 [Dorcoceras hygrometricum]
MNSRSLESVAQRIKNQQLTRSAKSGIRDDEVSSEVITISSELQCNQLILEVSDRKMMSRELQWIQSQATESCNQSIKNPVASYSGPSRRLQCFAYPVDRKSRRKEVAKNNKSQQSKTQPVAKQLTNYYEDLLKLDVNC